MQIVLAFMFACLGVAVARDDALGRYPLMGWNTWCTQNTCGVDWCNEAEILDVADTMIENGMQAAGYEYINLDDCWGVRDPETGKIEGDPLRFPNGMKSMISQLHAKGFKFGLYTDIGYKACHSPFTGWLLRRTRRMTNPVPYHISLLHRFTWPHQGRCASVC
eukprot:m.225144 g.225144  ORF g.225144 m.225144 type:complete len:163 (+) comp26380_c0_seq11:87-575(+)